MTLSTGKQRRHMIKVNNNNNNNNNKNKTTKQQQKNNKKKHLFAKLECHSLPMTSMWLLI